MIFDMSPRAEFSNSCIYKGEPLSYYFQDNSDVLMVKCYDGQKYYGISLNDVINIDLTLSHLKDFEVPICSKISIIRDGTRGKISLPAILFYRKPKVGRFIQPFYHDELDAGMWKVTKKRKKKSVGMILRIDEGFVLVELI